MLNSIDLNDKSYEDLLTEAISQIPLYSDEWTNYNISDPGITVLQNFSAFQLLQQSGINQVTDSIRRKLLKLLGFEAAGDKPARVFVSCDARQTVSLPAHKKFMVGGLCFETEAPVTWKPWGIGTVYSTDLESSGGYRDITYLLDREIPVGAAVFGQEPSLGMAVCCILKGKPEPGSQVTLWAQVEEDGKRNPFRAEIPVNFAELKWQCYTAKGWTDLKAQDATCGFLKSGAVHFSLPQEELAVFQETPQAGCAIRCVLTQADYDVAPRLQSLTANLMELVQKDTKSAGFSFPGDSQPVLRSEMAVFGNFFVCCREEEGGPYREYKLCGETQEDAGRWYYFETTEDGAQRICFDRERFGFGPGKGPDDIRVICWDEDTMYHRALGPIYGYEDQIVELDRMEHIAEDGFVLLVEQENPDEVPSYSFVAPGETDPDKLCYTVLSAEGQLLITQPGLGSGCRLFLCDCACTAGSGGNIREQNRFQPLREGGIPEGTVFRNPAAGQGGTTFETVEQVRLRFASEMRRPTTAVTVRDYEIIARETPGLCIRQVKAVAAENENMIRLAVQPFSAEKYPCLSETYLKQLRHWLEPRRPLSVRVELVQPKYIPINVKGTIYIKSYYADAETEIKAILDSVLDSSQSECGFGETILYDKLFKKLEQLPCVEFVYELFLIPQSRGDIIYIGHDIKLADHCMCRPGTYSLELNSRTGIPG